MTKEEVLEKLCERARDVNLYFGHNNRGEPFIKTHGGSDLEEFSKFYGGRVDEDVLTKNPRYFGMLCWAAVGGHAIELAKDLIECKSFWTSGKFRYATDLVEEHESNSNR